MKIMAYTFPDATPHGKLVEVLPDIFVVRGSTLMPGFMPLMPKFLSMMINVNMTVIRQGRSLTLVNTVRLDEQGLKDLDALGTVDHIVRVAAVHGKHDPFFKNRYPNATVWAAKGTHYIADFNNLKPDEYPEYFKADVYMDRSTKLPIANARLYFFDDNFNEVVLLLDREGGVLLSGDSMQNFDSGEYFNWAGYLMMRLAGFIKPTRLGLGWLAFSDVSPEAIAGLLDLEFANVLPSHGSPVIGDARSKYKTIIDETVASRGKQQSS